MNCRIFISCHKEADCLRSDIFAPIQVGTEVEEHTRLDDMLHDNEGENISRLNQKYCELTAQYWAWKNLDLDYYGFCHYRRYFNFSANKYVEDSYGNIREDYLDEDSIEKYGLTDENVLKCIQDVDIVITERKNLHSMAGKYSTPRDQYRNANKLHYKDFETMMDIIGKKYPEYLEAARQYADGHTACFCNMYIMKKEYFEEYCSWMFDILQEFCKCTDMSNYSTEALRTPGHLSERLFNIWLIHLIKQKKNLKIRELQCILFEHTDPQPMTLSPAFSNSIPVVFAANNGYIPMFAACYRSLLDHTSSESNYDVILVSSDLTSENKDTLWDMTKSYPNVSLRFYHPGRLLKNYKLQANAHISVETYYRFLIQSIIPDYKKVLYLDSDIIILKDIAELYQTNIDNYMLGAVRDVDFLGQINGANVSTLKYAHEELQMEDPYHYFQAGILLFNEDEMRREHSQDEWLTFASHAYMYNDQDVLNKYCENRVKYLDMSWNMLTDCDHYRVKNVIAYAPDLVQKEYARARKDPKIIHFAGFMKPWNRPTEDFAHEFWKYSQKTAYYEEILFNMMNGVADWKIRDGEWHNRGARRRKLINKFFPLGTNRRARLDKLYVHLYKRSTS